MADEKREDEKGLGGNGSNGGAPRGAASVVVTSSIDRIHHAVLARGQFIDLFRGFVEHMGLLGERPDPVVLNMMGETLAAGVLHLALLPPDQFCSWTINLADPQPMNLFVTGDNSSFRVMGRIFSEDVKALEKNRFFYETQRPKHEPARSVVEFAGVDILAAYQLFYDRSLQMQTRTFRLSESEFLLIQGLPIVDRGWLRGLDIDDAKGLYSQDLETIEDRVYRLECGCDQGRMLQVVGDVYAERPEELFQGESEIEVHCPRCGRLYNLPRALFDAN